MISVTERLRLRVIVWVGLALLILWLVFAGGAWAGLHLVYLRIASLVLVAVVLACWAIAAMRSERWLPRSHLLVPFGVSLVAFAIGTALSRQPRLGVEYLGYSALLAGLYLLLVRLLADPWFRARLFTLVTGLPVAIGVVYVGVVVMRWIEWWGLTGVLVVPPLRPGFASLTWGNPSAVLTMSVLLTAPAVAWIGLASPRRRIATILVVALAMTVSLLTGSRAGWLAIAVGAAATLLAAAVMMRHKVRDAFAQLSRRAVAAIGAAAIAGILLTAALLPAVLFRAGAGGADVRGAFFTAAVRMFVESPVHGTGPGTWVAQRIAYTDAPAADYYIPHAHNVVLQTLAEFGLLGALAGVIAIAAAGVLILRAVRDPDPLRKRVGLAGLFVAAYFGAHQMLDSYANAPAVLAAFAIMIAWLDATDPRPARALTRGPFLAALGLCAVALGGFGLVEMPARTHAEAVRLANEGDWNEAIEPARLAAANDPMMPAYQFTLGVVANRTGDPQTASAAFARAAAADDLPTSWLGLASAQVQLRQPAEARASLERALRLGGQQPAILMAAGDLYRQLGDREAATHAFAGAIAHVPSLAGDDWWVRAEPVAALWPQILDAAYLEVAPEAAAELALVTGDWEGVRARTAELPPARQRLFAILLGAWQHDPEALAALDDMARRNPFDLVLLNWCSRAYALAGDDGNANRYRLWAETVNGGGSLGGWELRVADGTMRPVEIAGISTVYYGHYTYRRPTPWDVIPPEAPHLTLE